MKQFPYRGAVVSLLLVLVLVTPPSAALERDGAFADTRGDLFTDQAVPVRLKDTLKGDFDRVPDRPGNWSARDDNSWPEILDRYLAYDDLLVRDYARPGLYIPVQLMVLSARQAQAFHNPQICFTVQGGLPQELAPTTIPVQGVANTSVVPVGRMLIEYPAGANLLPRLVYNLYIVERHLLAPDRTTWFRLSVVGVDPNNLTAADALLHDLAVQLVPTLFTASGDARTTWSWIAAGYGPGWAALATLLAVAPVGLEAAVLARKRT